MQSRSHSSNAKIKRRLIAVENINKRVKSSPHPQQIQSVLALQKVVTGLKCSFAGAKRGCDNLVLVNQEKIQQLVDLKNSVTIDNMPKLYGKTDLKLIMEDCFEACLNSCEFSLEALDKYPSDQQAKYLNDCDAILQIENNHFNIVLKKIHQNIINLNLNLHYLHADCNALHEALEFSVLGASSEATAFDDPDFYNETPALASYNC